MALTPIYMDGHAEAGNPGSVRRSARIAAPGPHCKAERAVAIE